MLQAAEARVALEGLPPAGSKRKHSTKWKAWQTWQVSMSARNFWAACNIPKVLVCLQHAQALRQIKNMPDFTLMFARPFWAWSGARFNIGRRTSGQRMNFILMSCVEGTGKEVSSWVGGTDSDWLAWATNGMVGEMGHKRSCAPAPLIDQWNPDGLKEEGKVLVGVVDAQCWKMATRTARWLCEQHDRRACEGTMPTKSLPKTQKGCRESRSKQISSLCGIMKNQEACWEQSARCQWPDQTRRTKPHR